MPETKYPPSQTLADPADLFPITYVEALQDLGAALAPDTDATIWTRAVPNAVQDWLDALPPQRLPSGRFVLPPMLVADCMAKMFTDSKIPSSPALNWLCEDAERMAHVVAGLVGTDLVRLRLEPVFDDACSKLHIDNVVARLICTYRGPGTILGLEPEIDAGLLNVQMGQPVLMKGNLWPGDLLPELRHRSPAIAGSGVSRLILVLEGCTENDIFPAYDDVYQS